MSEKNISVATWFVRKSLRNPNIGFEGIADFLLENEISCIELNTLILKSHSLYTPLIMRLLSVFLKQKPMGQVLKLLRDKGIKPIMITIDGTDMFQKSKKGINKQLEYIRSWVEPAQKAGINRVRVDLGLKPRFSNKKKMLSRLVKTFTPILEYIESLGMNIVVENHYGLSSSLKFLLDIKKEFYSPHFGFLLDIGNFRPRTDVYEGILKLKDSIKFVHAKTYKFNRNGEETRFNYRQIIENLKSVGFDGYYSIEFLGRGNDLENTKKTIELLRKYL